MILKIFGLGTDIVNIKRLEKILKRKKNTFKTRIFSKNEILYCDRKKNPLFSISRKELISILKHKSVAKHVKSRSLKNKKKSELCSLVIDLQKKLSTNKNVKNTNYNANYNSNNNTTKSKNKVIVSNNMYSLYGCLLHP